MTQVAGTTSDAGALSTLTVRKRGQDVAFHLSGTYSMVVALQREVGSPGSGTWETLKTWSTANATVKYIHTTQSEVEALRLNVTTDTSGTLSYSYADGQDETGAGYGVGSTPQDNIIVEEFGDEAVHKTVLTLQDVPLSVVSVTTGNGVGGITVYDFPEGYIAVHGASAELSLGVETQADFTDGTPEGDLGLGTLAPANADALGTDATDDNLCTATAFTMSSYVDSDINLPPDAAGINIDGTTTAVNAVLTALVDAADIDDDTTTNLIVNGKITIVWSNLGDY